MADEKGRDSALHWDIDGLDRQDENSGNEFDDTLPSASSAISSCDSMDASTAGSVVNSCGGRSGGSGSGSVGLADRLAGILVGDGDGDLLLQQSERESSFLQWLQALDMQVMGACRADERLKPLLKVNASSGVAEDRLLAHLCQHFEAAEVGLLARCLCIPLVSIRVGKITKQGTMLCPTSSRGNLNLTLLPSSDLRISFVGDDGQTERLATSSSSSECSTVAVKEIKADQSGRSFLIHVPQHEIFYFWCSEKSKLLGTELLSKMKDLLERKPTLAELTGISEVRLECFATHLRAYLMGSNVNTAQGNSTASAISLMDTRSDTHALGHSAHSFTATSAKPSRSRHNGAQALRTHLVYQGSLSPRSNSFKDGLSRTFSALRGASREKMRRRGDIHFSTADNAATSPAASSVVGDVSLNQSDKVKHPDGLGSSLASPLSFLESVEKSSFTPILSTSSQHPPTGSLFSPYYCWCPLSSLPCTVPTPHLPISLAEPFSLPPLSSLLPATRSASLLTQSMPFGLSDTPSLDFPDIMPDPILHHPFSKQSSQQVPTFTPLMCDPIVHIPVIDFCSSGQGYLVSAGPAVATSIPPLLPKLVSPLISESESVVDKGARETLRLLISSSSQCTTPLMDMLPAVLTSKEEKQGVLVAGSRGLYGGTTDFDAISRSLAAAGLVPLSERSVGVGSRGLYGVDSDINDISSSFAAVGFAQTCERSSGVIGSGGSGSILDTSEGMSFDFLEDSGNNVPDPTSSFREAASD
ncbi:hypothetical protein Dimus_033686 [Dionaea muscipula]